ncbi:hypothetical protein VNO77_21354 [Canavalia gladiata]|uniref:Uncharacterized protein n=1 Tax=Canavalia gladiata TaxID=3824 RepID=A0AAN9LQW4_CANGL
MASNNGHIASEMFHGQVLLYRHLFAFMDTMCLKWIVDLGIPDIIHNHGQPITLQELASILQLPLTKVTTVQCLMRHLAHNGFFEIVKIQDKNKEKEAYALTAASKLLVKGIDFCLAPMVECTLIPTMLASSHQWKEWTYDLLGSNNLTYVGGNMLESIPKANAVLLKNVLHNWSDDDCKKILENCKVAISSNGKRGKVILIDIVINDKQDEHLITGIKLLMNVNMRCLVNGKERSEEEWKKLFVEAGFQEYKISPLTGVLSLVEIYP